MIFHFLSELEYKSDSVDKFIDYFEGGLERESNQFQKTIHLIGKLQRQKHKTVLYPSYIENKTANEVSEIVGLGEREIYRVTNEAIQELDEMLIIQGF